MNTWRKIGMLKLVATALLLSLVGCGGDNPVPPPVNPYPTNPNQPFNPTLGGGGNCGVRSFQTGGGTTYGSSMVFAFGRFFGVAQNELTLNLSFGAPTFGSQVMQVQAVGALIFPDIVTFGGGYMPPMQNQQQSTTICVTTAQTNGSTSFPSFYAPSDGSIDLTLRGFANVPLTFGGSTTGYNQYGQVPVQLNLGSYCPAYISYDGRITGCVDITVGQGTQPRRYYFQ